MDQGGNYWTLFTPGIWKVLHAVLHVLAEAVGDPGADRAKFEIVDLNADGEEFTANALGGVIFIHKSGGGIKPPKTRSGLILRRVLRAINDGQPSTTKVE